MAIPNSSNLIVRIVVIDSTEAGTIKGGAKKVIIKNIGAGPYEFDGNTIAADAPDMDLFIWGKNFGPLVFDATGTRLFITALY